MSTGPDDVDTRTVAALPAADAILFQLALLVALGLTALSAAVGEDPARVAEEVARLARAGLIETELRAGREHFVLTAAGRARAAEVVAAEAAALRPLVTAIDAEFVALNRRVKQILHRWQVRVDRTTEVLNDHGDARYDALVLADLRTAQHAAERLLAPLAALRGRYASLCRRLAAALARALAGERGAVAGVTGDSFHAAWWELHADLLRVLGRARGADDA